MNVRPALLSWKFLNCLLAFMLVCGGFSIYFQESPGGCGDYPQNFQMLYRGLGLGAFLGLVFHFASGRIPYAWVAQPALLTVIRLFLASSLLSYGYAKVFASQFPHLMANMDARMIELSPMRVAWAFFGYSKGYQQFLGWGEVIPAVLLLFRRTTLIGALMMFIVMMNVFLVNVFFDVCVKLNSGIFMVLALYILLQEFDRLWNFFIGNKVTAPRADIIQEAPRWLRLTGRIMTYLALAYIVYIHSEGAYQTYQYATSHVAKTPVQGPWKTLTLSHWHSKEWWNKAQGDSLHADRVFFDGYNGVIKSDFIRDRFRFTIDSVKKEMIVRFTNSRNEWNIAPLTWRYEKTSPDTLQLWVRWRQDSLMMHCVLRKEKLTRY